jgi:hypothetical protein
VSVDRGPKRMATKKHLPARAIGELVEPGLVWGSVGSPVLHGCVWLICAGDLVAHSMYDYINLVVHE